MKGQNCVSRGVETLDIDTLRNSKSTLCFKFFNTKLFL